jgi:hypothetical protein
MEEILSKIYNDSSNPAAFAGIRPLWKEAQKIDKRITLKDVKHYLEGHRTYSLMRPRRVHFPRSKTFASGFMSDCHLDLADFSALSRTNKGYKYLLLGIDVLSKRVFVEPLRSKKSPEMVIAFDNLFKSMPMVPMRCFTDLGGEFRNKLLKEYFEKEDIHKLEASSATVKASLAERAIRNLKQRLYRYFSHNKTTTWINVVQTIVNGINRSKSRVHGMRPIDVNFENAQQVWNRIYGDLLIPKRKLKPKFKVGDLVRVSIGKGIFEKGYIPSWGDQILEIDSIVSKSEPVKYRLANRGQLLKRHFYGEELAIARKETDIEKKIEKTLRKRKLPDGTLEVLVKYVGIEEPEWIHEDQLQ